MVKGTSRQVIVVHSPDQKLFDQAIFILKDGAVGEGITDEALLREAKQYINTPRKKQPAWLNYGPVWGAAGAGLGWLLALLL